MRGNHVHTVAALDLLRSIPAHAGEPELYKQYADDESVYPAHAGNLALHLAISALVRSIPAHAGEPAGPAAPIVRVMVYPHPCGGTGIP